MAHLLFKDVNKVYPNGYHAVHDFNMEIRDGEVHDPENDCGA